MSIQATNLLTYRGDIPVSKMTWLRAGRGRVGVHLFSISSRSSLEFTQLLIQSVAGVISPGVNPPGLEVGHSPPPGVKVSLNNAWRYIPTPSYVYMAWYLITFISCLFFSFLLNVLIFSSYFSSLFTIFPSLLLSSFPFHVYFLRSVSFQYAPFKFALFVSCVPLCTARVTGVQRTGYERSHTRWNVKLNCHLWFRIEHLVNSGTLH